MSQAQRARRLRNAGAIKQPKLEEGSHSEELPDDSDSADSRRGALADYKWYSEYEELCQRYNWRIAAYIAWIASPRVGRRPATQMALAQALGLKSDRIIRKWREEQPEIEGEIKRLQASPLIEHRRDIYETLVKGALDVAYGHADRKLALEILGDYRGKVDHNLQLSFEFTADEAAQAEAELRAFEAGI